MTISVECSADTVAGTVFLFAVDPYGEKRRSVPELLRRLCALPSERLQTLGLISISPSSRRQEDHGVPRLR
jgi:hypothetical protein